jgi:hypothetical protein
MNSLITKFFIVCCFIYTIYEVICLFFPDTIRKAYRTCDQIKKEIHPSFFYVKIVALLALVNITYLGFLALVTLYLVIIPKFPFPLFIIVIYKVKTTFLREYFKRKWFIVLDSFISMILLLLTAYQLKGLI